MSGNLPISLPSKKIQNVPSLPQTSVSAHAQNFSVTQLQQKKDLENAKTSITHVGDHELRNRATTSISRAGQDNTTVSTSISHQGRPQHQTFEDSSGDAVRDRLRYQYVRRLIRARQEREAAEVRAAAQGDTKHTINLGTGATFSRKIRGGFNKVFSKMVRKNPSTYKHVSAQDKQVLGNIIQKHAQARPTGTGFSFGDRKRMKIEVEQARRKGVISKDDSKDFKKIVGNLD